MFVILCSSSFSESDKSPYPCTVFIASLWNTPYERIPVVNVPGKPLPPPAPVSRTALADTPVSHKQLNWTLARLGLAEEGMEAAGIGTVRTSNSSKHITIQSMNQFSSNKRLRLSFILFFWTNGWCTVHTRWRLPGAMNCIYSEVGCDSEIETLLGCVRPANPRQLSRILIVELS